MRNAERFPGLDDRSCKRLVYASKTLIGKYGFTHDDLEDIQQELYLHLYQQLPKYDPSKAGIATFVQRVLTHGVINLIRHQQAQKRDYDKCRRSLDEPMDFDGEDSLAENLCENEQFLFGTQPYHTNNMDNVDLMVDIQRALALIEPRKRRFCFDVMSGKSATRIAREHGICRDTFYAWKRQIRSILESAGLHAYLGLDAS